MWDERYRPLKFGEIIRSTDEVMMDDGTWKEDGGRCAGTQAPDSAYTSHRQYRRMVSEPFFMTRLMIRFLRWCDRVLDAAMDPRPALHGQYAPPKNAGHRNTRGFMERSGTIHGSEQDVAAIRALEEAIRDLGENASIENRSDRAILASYLRLHLARRGFVITRSN